MNGTTYTFTEGINLKDLAKRICATVNFDELMTLFESEEEAINETVKEIKNNPINIISCLIDRIEELQNEE